VAIERETRIVINMRGAEGKAMNDEEDTAS
jgi:hypothetical protein